MAFSVCESMTRLAKEYISKVKCCDECFCEYWCIENQFKDGRLPKKGCEHNVIKYLADTFREVR